MATSFSQEEAGAEQVKLTKIEKMFDQVKESFSKMADNQVKDLLKEKTKGTFAEGLFEKFPKIYDFLSGFLRSKEAMGSLLSITKDKTRLLYFGLCMLITFIAAFIIKKRDQNLGKSMILSWFKRWLMFTAIRLSIIYYFFSDELSPIFKVFKETIL